MLQIVNLTIERHIVDFIMIEVTENIAKTIIKASTKFMDSRLLILNGQYVISHHSIN